MILYFPFEAKMIVGKIVRLNSFITWDTSKSDCRKEHEDE